MYRPGNCQYADDGRQKDIVIECSEPNAIRAGK